MRNTWHSSLVVALVTCSGGCKQAEVGGTTAEEDRSRQLERFKLVSRAWLSRRPKELSAQARSILDECDDDRCVELVRAALRSNDPEVALGAMMFMAEADDLTERDEQYRLRRFFRSLNEDVRPFLWHNHFRFRKVALGLLAEDRDEARYIAELLHDPHPEVVTYAIAALATSGDADSVMALVSMIRRNMGILSEESEPGLHMLVKVHPKHQLESWNRICAGALGLLTRTDKSPEEWLEWSAGVRGLPVQEIVKWSEKEGVFRIYERPE